jgi:hypothetical protein
MFLMTGLDFILNARAFAGERAAGKSSTIAVGRRIVNREVVGGESPDSSVAGQGAGFIEHVWTCDGVEVARHYMPIGTDRRWRTWSRHRLRAGDYVVEVFAPDGRRLARHAFTAFPSA